MRVIRTSISTACFAAALLLGACGSTGLDDILGGGTGGSSGGNSIGDVRGTVASVDTRNRVIVVDADPSYRADLRNGGNDEVALYYDDRTVVEFEGRRYDPEDLERGDRIAARIDESAGRLLAEQIEVLQDATGGIDSGAATGADTFGDLRGFVRSIDTRDRTIELENIRYERGFDSGGSRGQVVVVHYDPSTVVEFQGRSYSPENLERGDEVEVEVRDLGNRLLAEEIVVVNDVRGGLR